MFALPRRAKGSVAATAGQHCVFPKRLQYLGRQLAGSRFSLMQGTGGLVNKTRQRSVKNTRNHLSSILVFNSACADQSLPKLIIIIPGQQHSESPHGCSGVQSPSIGPRIHQTVQYMRRWFPIAACQGAAPLVCRFKLCPGPAPKFDARCAQEPIEPTSAGRAAAIRIGSVTSPLAEGIGFRLSTAAGLLL